MTYEEMKAQWTRQKARRRPDDEEHRLQCACVQWFRLQYPNNAGLLYAVPNGGRRDAATGARLKAEGVLAGVSDLNLDLPNRYYHGLRIEMKTLRGRQRETQRQYQQAVEAVGYRYAVCRDFDSFRGVVEEYMKGI